MHSCPPLRRWQGNTRPNNGAERLIWFGRVMPPTARTDSVNGDKWGGKLSWRRRGRAAAGIGLARSAGSGFSCLLRRDMNKYKIWTVYALHFSHVDCWTTFRIEWSWKCWWAFNTAWVRESYKILSLLACCHAPTNSSLYSLIKPFSPLPWLGNEKN